MIIDIQAAKESSSRGRLRLIPMEDFRDRQIATLTKALERVAEPPFDLICDSYGHAICIEIANSALAAVRQRRDGV